MTRSSAAAPARADVYTRVTNRIIADLENGVRPWLKRPALRGHQRADAVGRGDRQGPHLANMDDVSAGGRAWRASPQGRARLARRLCRPTSARPTPTTTATKSNAPIPQLCRVRVLNCQRFWREFSNLGKPRFRCGRPSLSRKYRDSLGLAASCLNTTGFCRRLGSSARVASCAVVVTS
jgi:hypothetical protein